MPIPEIDELKKRRKNLELTQKELAVLCAISQSIIAKIESKKVNPSYSIVKKIIDTLDSLERKNELMAKQIMNNKIISVNKNTKVSKAIKLMKFNGYSQLPVFDGTQSVGSISDKTITDLIVSGKSISEINSLKVKNVMDDAFPTISEATSISIVSAILRDNHAVLVTKKHNTVGIITKSDLLKISK